MKLLHTSDLLLGQPFAHCHQVADRARAARMEALRTILALGRKQGAEAIVVAGNLWADNRVGLAVIEEAAALLSKSAVPVYLLPGHRDPITADSPYELYPDRFAGKVKVLASSDPLILKGGVTLLPFPVNKRGAGGDPTRGLPDREREPLRIAVVNTSPEGHRLAPGGLAKRELDYLCAGGEVERKTEDGVHWCGSPEPTAFGQQCGTVNMVELSPGQPAETRPVSTAGLEWRDEVASAGEPSELKELSTRWSRHEQRATTLLRLTLRGRLDLEGMSSVEELRRTLTAKLLHLELRLEIAPGLEGGAFRHPLLGAVAASLTEKAANGGRGASPEGLAEAEVAREALAILLKILQNSPHPDLV
jgi:DNA repair exonuclease SbcCD nuclease subunit